MRFVDKETVIVGIVAFLLGALVVFLIQQHIQALRYDRDVIMKLFDDQDKLIQQDDTLIHEFSLCIDPGQCSIEKIGAMGKNRYDVRQALIAEEKKLLGM